MLFAFSCAYKAIDSFYCLLRADYKRPRRAVDPSHAQCPLSHGNCCSEAFIHCVCCCTDPLFIDLSRDLVWIAKRCDNDFVIPGTISNVLIIASKSSFLITDVGLLLLAVSFNNLRNTFVSCFNPYARSLGRCGRNLVCFVRAVTYHMNTGANRILWSNYFVFHQKCNFDLLLLFPYVWTYSHFQRICWLLFY